ncbi:hypothetical protein BAU14_01585 [Enterococcus sp. CU9D]|nr:hypothetical protein BAU14_01585 [Enterococcus sp. CU9D]
MMTEKKWRRLFISLAIGLVLILILAVGNQVTGHGDSNKAVFISAFVASGLLNWYLIKELRIKR